MNPVPKLLSHRNADGLLQSPDLEDLLSLGLQLLRMRDSVE